MNVETLNALVTSAIWRAEQLEDDNIEAAARTWREVSDIEERLAQILPPSQNQGRIARRGAVRAALKANDCTRAARLADAYRTEKGVPQTLKASLREMLEEDVRKVASRYPHAAKHHSVGEVRDVARHFHESGAFGLAA